MLQALFAVAAVVFFVLAGLKVSGRFFAPEWYGAACAAIVLFWPVLKILTA